MGIKSYLSKFCTPYIPANAAFGWLVVGRFLSSCAFYAALPYFSLLIITKGHIAPAKAGAILGIVLTCSRLFSTLAGVGFDKVPSKKWLLISIMTLCMGTAFALSVVQSPILMLCYLSLFNAAIGASIVGYRSTVHLFVPPHQTGVSFAQMMVSFHLGTLIGPLIGQSFISNQDFSQVFIGSSGLAFLSVVALWFIQPKPVPHTPMSTNSAPSSAPADPLIASTPRASAPILFNNLPFPLKASLMMLYVMAWVGLQQSISWFPVYCRDYFQDLSLIPTYFLIQAIGSILCLPLIGKALQQVTLWQLVVWFSRGCWALPAGFLFLAFIPFKSGMVGILALFNILCLITVFPTSDLFISRVFPSRTQGRAFGIFQFLQALGFGSGIWLGGILYQYAQDIHILPAYWVLIGSICLVVCSLPVYIVYRHRQLLSSKHS